MADTEHVVVEDQTTLPDRIALTMDDVTARGADACADALAAAGVTVTRHTFLPPRPDEYSTAILLLATSGPPPPLARLVAPALAPSGIVEALVAALEIEGQAAPATLQLKAAHVFVSIQARDRADLLGVLDGLAGELARLDGRGGERRLVYRDGAWAIDP